LDAGPNSKSDVCLIVPPNIFLLDPVMYPPLGPLYVASALEKEGHDVTFLDLRTVEDLESVTFPRTKHYGLTATTAGYEYAVKIKNLIKAQNPGGIVFIGGAHASVKPDEVAEEFDAVIVGEGEKSVFKVLRGERGVIESPLIENLDSIQYPARHLLRPTAQASRHLLKGEKYGVAEAATTITSTRGCPFRCAYCAAPTIWGGKVRFRSPENFVGEIKQVIADYGCRSFRFIDDNFPLKRDRILRITDLLEPLGIKFRCHTRTSLVDEEILSALKGSGCTELAFGVEVADDYVLEKIQKDETVEDHETGIRLAKEAGLLVRAYLMVALPFETWGTIANTKRFMRRNRRHIDTYTLSTFAAYPGSDIYNHPSKYDIVWMERQCGKLLQFSDRASIATEQCSRRELTEHRNELSTFLKKVWSD